MALTEVADKLVKNIATLDTNTEVIQLPVGADIQAITW